MAKTSLTEQIDVATAAEDQFALVKLIMQLSILQEQIKPILPQASKKLVNDLLGSGCTAKRLGKIIGRSPGYVQSIGNGKASLTASTFTKLVRHAISSGQQNAAK